MSKHFKFSFQRKDQWGNGLVHCPICNWTFKLDGVRKHIIVKCRNGDKKHCDWFKNHKWNKGTKTPASAKPNIRP
jgi:hypothetical protein